MTTEKIKFNNFNIKLFSSLLNQNLAVDPQITIKFTPDFVKSTSISISATLVKMWTVKTSSFITLPKVDADIIDLDEENNQPDVPKFEPFNFYVFLGQTFKNYLSVYGSDTVNLIIDVDRDTNNATLLTIEGQSVAGTNLKTQYILSSDDIITYKNQDYESLNAKMQRTDNMINFTLSGEQVKEINMMIKKLHKVDPKNCTYLKFNVKNSEKSIVISDKVFDIKYPFVTETELTNVKDFSFNLLKSDFIVTGNHTYNFSIEPEGDDKSVVLLESVYKNCVIFCMVTKAKDISKNVDSNMDTVDEPDFDTVDIDEYFVD